MSSLQLTSGETLYLALAIGSFTLFAATLMWVRLDYTRQHMVPRPASRSPSHGSLPAAR